MTWTPSDAHLIIIFGTSIRVLRQLGLRVKHKPSSFGNDMPLAIYSFWISVNHLFHLDHFHFTAWALSPLVYLTCAFSIATSTEDPLSEAEPIRLHIPLALSLWSDLDLRKIYLDWVLGKKTQPWLLGEHQNNSLLLPLQVPNLYSILYIAHHQSLDQTCYCVGW